MEKFCKIGQLEKKQGYDVCRGIKTRGELRYDLTKIFPGRRTHGHYHIKNEPELYETQSGIAEFLMQNRNATKTYTIKAKKGEKIIIPPGFSMRAINPSSKNKLIISNWVNKNVKNNYNAFKKIQRPASLKPKKLPGHLKNLDFLTNPQKYKKFLTLEKLYYMV